MKTIFWAGPLCGGAAMIAICTALTSATTFTFRHPRHPHKRFVVKGDRVVYEPSAEERAAERLAPRVEIRETSHDFGFMPPGDQGQHEFVVKNVGQGPLRLLKGRTTCKCAFPDLPNDAIAPGEEGRVRLIWNTGRDRDYLQTAEIKTNDPRRPSFRLLVKGRVEIRTGVAPQNLVLPRLEPGVAAERRILVYSRVWPKFKIERIHCSLSEARCRIEPVSPEVLQENKAKSGYWLMLRLPPRDPGRFHGLLNFQLAPVDVAEPAEPIEMEIAGQVLRRLSIYGKQIDSEGVLHLGVATRGVGSEHRLLVKVKDDVLDLGRTRITCTPNFVHARLTPHPEMADIGLYELVVGVAANAPLCSYLGDQRGEIRLSFEHPRIREQVLSASFSVMERQP